MSGRAWLLGRGGEVPAGIDEKELWPDAVWRLAALLRAGATPAFALGKLAQEAARTQEEGEGQRTGWRVRWDAEARGLAEGQADCALLFARCEQAARLGLPVSAASRELPLSRAESRERARELAACWQVAERTGAPLAQVLERYARYLENDIDLGQQREAAMSGPRATGRILSWLPLLGLGLGVLMGTDPLGVLFGSLAGALIGVAGVGLALVGSRWTARLTRTAERGEL